MWRSLPRTLFVVAITACDSDLIVPGEPEPEPAPQFGTVAVQVGGRRWFVLPGPDSVVGYFDPQIRQLMVQAPSQGGPGYRQLISLRICGVPTVQG